MKKKNTRKVNAVSGTVIRGALSFIFYTLVIAFLISAAKAGYQFGYDVFNGDSLTAGKGTVVQYTVEESESIRQIASDLENMGVIADKNVMIVQKVFYKVNIIPGTYELNSGMTSMEVLDWMSMLSHSIAEEKPAGAAAAETTRAETEAVQETGAETQVADGESPVEGTGEA